REARAKPSPSRTSRRRWPSPGQDPPPSSADGEPPRSRPEPRAAPPLRRHRRTRATAPALTPALCAHAKSVYAMAFSTRVLDIRVEEGRGRAVDIAQADAVAGRWRQLIVADCDRGLVECARSVLDPEKPDHAVLLDAVARDAETPDQLAATINRKAAGEDLQPIGQLGLAAGDDGQHETWRQGQARCQPYKRTTLRC